MFILCWDWIWVTPFQVCGLSFRWWEWFPGFWSSTFSSFFIFLLAYHFTFSWTVSLVEQLPDVSAGQLSFCCHSIYLPWATMFSFVLRVFPLYLSSNRAAVHFKNTIKNQTEEKSYPYKSFAHSPPNWKFLFHFPYPASLFLALLSLSGLCATSTVL